jgi:hypothetical protein
LQHIPARDGKGDHGAMAIESITIKQGNRDRAAPLASSSRYRVYLIKTSSRACAPSRRTGMTFSRLAACVLMREALVQYLDNPRGLARHLT